MGSAHHPRLASLDRKELLAELNPLPVAGEALGFMPKTAFWLWAAGSIYLTGPVAAVLLLVGARRATSHLVAHLRRPRQPHPSPVVST